MNKAIISSKRYTSIILLVVAFFLFGCSISNNNDSGEAVVETHNSVRNNNVELNFTYWGSPDEKNAIETACRKFTENYPWIIINPIQIPNSNYNIKMMTMVATNNAPDTGYMTGDLGETWANEGKFVNLFEMIDLDAEMSKEDFLDYIWFKLNPNNAWGISTAGECFGLFYNKDLLKEAGIDSLPSRAEDAMSWDEFVALAKKLTIDKNGRRASEPGFDPNNIKQYGVLFETWEVPISNFIFSNDGKWLSEDGKRFTLNSPEASEAIQKLADLINVHHVAPSPHTAKSFPSMSIALQSGLVAMVVGGQWINLDLGNAGANYDIGVLPKLKRSITVCVSGATVLFKSSKHLEEAWLLFKWMSNPDNTIELYSGGLWMPIMKKWYTDPVLVSKWVDANPSSHPPGFRYAMMNQLLNNGVPQPLYYMKNSSRIIPVVISGLDPVWFGRKTAAEALQEIEEKVQPEIKGRYDIE